MPDYHCNIDSVLLADVSNFSQDQNPVADEHAQSLREHFWRMGSNTRDSNEAYPAAIIHTSHLLRQEALTLLYRNTSFHIGRDQSIAFANENETAAQADGREEITT
ncbi:MAG: hypothetical protein Q9203_005774, partial [Teloschistes exilis]